MSKTSQELNHSKSKMFGSIKKAAGNVGRFLASTGKSALQKIGDTASTIRKVGGAINTATGGAAGKAWEASKSMPGIGAITTNLEKGLGLAEKASAAGLKAIDIGERGVKAARGGNLAGTSAAVKEARGLYNSFGKKKR